MFYKNGMIGVLPNSGTYLSQRCPECLGYLSYEYGHAAATAAQSETFPLAAATFRQAIIIPSKSPYLRQDPLPHCLITPPCCSLML